MLPTRFKISLSAARPVLLCVKRLSSVHIPDAEYTAEPKYPAIFDPSPKAEERRVEEKWHDKVKSHPTIEEKLFEINMPKYYGWHTVMVHEKHAPYNYLPMAQFSTRTVFIEEPVLTSRPDKERIDSFLSELLPTVKGPLEDVILFHHSCRNRNKPADELLLRSINRILLSNLAPSIPHVNDVETSHNPRLEAFWFLGGVDKPPMEELDRYFRQEFYSRHKPFTNDRAYQYIGQPILHVKSRQPLPQLTERRQCENPKEVVADYPYDPSVHDYQNKYFHATTLPGFWPGSHYEFGLFSFHSRKHLDNRSSEFEPEEQVEAIHANAIFSSFAWLLGQAYFQGFSTFQDVTYPLVTQTALTDGRLWSFYLYQLNTTLLHHENSQENKYYNLCWGTRTQELFKSVEDGRIIGFNDDVLKQILEMYLLAPSSRPDVVMKPYLGEKYLVHHIDYEERRDWLHAHFRRLLTNKLRATSKMEFPEPMTSEKIYLTYYPLDRIKKKLEFFQLGIDPHDRRLDEHTLKYRPRKLRELRRQKFYRSFYPGTNLEPEIFYKKPRKT